ncbi:MAG: N-acetyl-gamma-glutamyl-phosphate reductase [Bacteroidetes bacterium]|nr:N-acetyl-gamma-glutamyl-phosphate reductase [Bacteroidota bacterium]
MIQAGIIGASGYTGQELYRILSSHPEVTIKVITSRTYAGQPLGSVYGNLYSNGHTKGGSAVFSNATIQEAAEVCDVLFLALPHGLASHQVTPELLTKTHIIDLGADYRLKSQDIYETWYKTEHGSPELLPEAVYGLCEWFREEIKHTKIVANPGCYTTCSILTLAPLLKAGLIDPETIIIDAKSGISGAGRAAKTGSLYAESNESVKAYGVASHRHTPEIEEQLSTLSGSDITISFTPHLIPMNRGILITAYATPKPGVTGQDITDAYHAAYNNEYFIRLLPTGVFPETRWVKGSNFCDIGYTLDTRTNRLIMGGAIDNLVKGASGQAVQNMNIMFCLKEQTGIDSLPIFPA